MEHVFPASLIIYIGVLLPLKRFRMYYTVKVTWQQPKEGDEGLQKMSKGFLVFAESCTEAEGKMVSWIPANYQDAVVTDVIKTKIGDLRIKGPSETFWLIKIMDDLDGKAEKATAFLALYNADHLEEAVRRCATDTSSELEAVTKFKVIVDEDLTSTAVTIKRKVVPIAAPVIEEEEDEEDEA